MAKSLTRTHSCLGETGTAEPQAASNQAEQMDNSDMHHVRCPANICLQPILYHLTVAGVKSLLKCIFQAAHQRCVNGKSHGKLSSETMVLLTTSQFHPSVGHWMLCTGRHTWKVILKEGVHVGCIGPAPPIYCLIRVSNDKQVALHSMPGSR